MDKIATISQTRRILDEYDIMAKKRYGQNFLVDYNIVEKIINEVDDDSNVIEIGPGLGALSQFLVEKGASYQGYDIDEDMIRAIKGELGDINVYNEDFLNVSLEDVVKEPAVLVSNLPYYITSELLYKVFKESWRFEKVIVMLQKEVGQRILKKERDKDYNQVNVLIDLTSEAELLCNVKKRSFFPQPNVDSCVLVMTVKEHTPLEEGFFPFLDACFSHRRKLLTSNLKEAGYQLSEAALKELTNKRIEEVTAQQLYELYRSL